MCHQCGGPLPTQTRGRHRKYCNTECQATANLRRVHNARAQALNLWDEDINPTAVFERDHWTCQICGTPALASTRTTERPPLMATIDHITPLKRGGRHNYRNVQCTHLACNLRKKTDLEIRPEII